MKFDGAIEHVHEQRTHRLLVVASPSPPRNCPGEGTGPHVSDHGARDCENVYLPCRNPQVPGSTLLKSK